MAYDTREERIAYAKGLKAGRFAEWPRADGQRVQMGNAGGGPPVDASPRRQSNQRFRSFAERYMVERATHFRAEHIAEDTWACLMDARRAYDMIKRVGFNVLDDNGF